jgi:dynamin GTPase/dynamin 1-like protein
MQEVDPCKNISDEDIRTSIQNSGGPKGAMFLPEV